MQELWFGKDAHGRRVELLLVHATVWPGIAWRVEWGPPGRRQRESFNGLDMEAQARSYFAQRQAELGTGWEMVRRS